MGTVLFLLTQWVATVSIGLAQAICQPWTITGPAGPVATKN